MPDDLSPAKSAMLDFLDDWTARLRRQIAEAETQETLDAIGRRALDRMPDLLEG